MGAPEFTMNRTSRSLSLKPTVSLSRKGQRRRQKKSFIDKRSSSSEQNHLSRKRQEVENGSELEKSTPEERSGFDGCGIQVQIVFAYNQQMVRKRDCNEGPRDYS
ncbi:uncharacterized protein LOC110877116 [Helianthus annuus]|uniref:uncharacterized protein LOC110877116 n=1 Tax=Helianthus annuus TaxID=4232 RepID=UPI001653372C|nr:uncharacterized protein LOC110877116 [Helianthus annuus]